MKHTDIYEKYQKDVQQLDVSIENEITPEFGTFTNQILFAEHFRVIGKNGNKLITVACNHCNKVLKSSKSIRKHLKVILFWFY